jgi:arsenite methyltransferase
MPNQLAVLNCCAPVAASVIPVRSALAADLPAALAILEKANLPTQGVTDHFERGYAVLEQNHRIVGLAGLEIYGNDALLRSVAIDDAFRGHGHGRLLVRERLQWAREHGIADVYLLTTSAAAFFADLGFERIDRAQASEAVRAAPEFAYTCCSTAATMKISVASGADVRSVVRARYADAARAAASGEQCACCGGRKSAEWNPITSDLYQEAQTEGLPAEALLASLGCGNPTALTELKPGEVVLDLGSGGGIDVLLSAKRVAPAGKAYGLDMTDEMLELARANQKRAGATNVEFLKGEIENVPLPDNSVDVIISNCVINLSADKAKVLKEAFRVLKPGGRFAVSDIVVRGEMPEAIRRNFELWTGCVAGALEENTYLELLHQAGFESASVEVTRVYGREDIAALAEDAGVHLQGTAESAIADRFISAFIRAKKPR